MAKEIKSDHLRAVSPPKGRPVDDTQISQQVRRCCTYVSQLLTDIATNEQNRNKLVSSIKEEMKNLREDIKYQLAEVSRHIGFLRTNNQKVTAIITEDTGAGRRGRSMPEEFVEEPRSKSKYIFNRNNIV